MPAAMQRRILVEIVVVALAIVAAALARSYLIAVYVIPSESMLPTLVTGDYILAERWPFRLAARLPARGDVVVFHAPPNWRRDYVKRVIGLPGDRVALRHGTLVLNGRALPRWRIADLVVPVSPNSPCVPAENAFVRAEREPDGTPACRYPRFREMLPEGRAIDLLDLGYTDGDDFAETTVPAGHVFVLGDNRDRSADSRWPAKDGGAVGMVPLAALVGRVGPVLFSVDGSARLRAPGTWAPAVRWSRIGGHP